MYDYEIPSCYKYHHSAYAKGYVSRKGIDREAEPYKGKFGIGFLVRRPLWNTTRYHEVSYYILADNAPVNVLRWADDVADAMTDDEWSHLHDNDPRKDEVQLF